MTDPFRWSADDIDTTRPAVARMYNYLLGGAHNFAVDRAAVDQATALPFLPATVRANRDFLRRAVTFLAGQGVDRGTVTATWYRPRSAPTATFVSPIAAQPRVRPPDYQLRPAAARRRVFRRIQELSATDVPAAEAGAYLETVFTHPDQLLGGPGEATGRHAE
jgi:hypothetical protein